MSTDKQLTRLAAKAADIKYPGGDHSVHDDGRLWDCKLLRWWNPLHDDGDALRLAVKLKLEILFFDGFGEIAVEHNNDGHFQVTEQYADDMNAATRRAIVRAAAEIGRSME